MLSNIKAEMARENIEVNEIALAIGQHRNTVSDKLAGKRAFTVPEAVKIKTVFFPEMSLEYLFATNDQPQKSA